MPINKTRESSAPIKIEQCTLNKFFPNLPEPKSHSLVTELERRNGLSNVEGYTLRIKRNGMIYLRNTLS